MPKPLSKEQLFINTRKVIDIINSQETNENNKIKFSDKELRENIDSKYNLYVEANELQTERDERKAKNKEKLSKAGCCLDLRDAESVSLDPNDEKEIERLIKQTNTPEKARNYHTKAIKDVVGTDYEKVVNAATNPRDAMNFYKENRFVSEIGFTMSANAATVHKNGYNIPKELNEFANDRKVYEAPFVSINAQIALASNPAFFLFKGTSNTFSKEKTLNMLNSMGQAMQVDPSYGMGFQHLGVTSKDETQDFVNASKNFKKDKDMSRNLLDVQPHPGKSMSDALFGEHGFNLTSASKRRKNQLDKAFKSTGLEADLIKTPKQRQEYELELCDKRINQERSYKNMSRASRFFSHFVPNSWTKAGKLRNEIENTKKEMANAEISENHYSNYRKKYEQRYEAKEYFDERQNLDSAIASKMSQKEARNFYGDMKTVEIDVPEMDEDEDELEQTEEKKATGRKNIEISDAKDAPNSSKDNVVKEDSAAEMTNEKEMDID